MKAVSCSGWQPCGRGGLAGRFPGLLRTGPRVESSRPAGSGRAGLVGASGCTFAVSANSTILCRAARQPSAQPLWFLPYTPFPSWRL